MTRELRETKVRAAKQTFLNCRHETGSLVILVPNCKTRHNSSPAHLRAQAPSTSSKWKRHLVCLNGLLSVMCECRGFTLKSEPRLFKPQKTCLIPCMCCTQLRFQLLTPKLSHISTMCFSLLKIYCVLSLALGRSEKVIVIWWRWSKEALTLGVSSEIWHFSLG